MSKTASVSPRVRGHYQRMSQSVCHYPKHLSEPYQVRGVEEFVENGRVLKKSASQTVDPKQNFVGYNVSDFYLENIIAAGALDSLKETKLSDGILSASDNLDAQIGSLDAAILDDVEPKND